LNYVSPKINEHPIFKRIANYTPEEERNFKNFIRRWDSIVKLSKEKNNWILVDAEQTYIQDAIRNITEQFQYLHNSDKFHILNTYQGYLKATRNHINIERYKRDILKSPLKVKLVRGAYMVEERHLASKHGYESPVHDCLEDTHSSYNDCALKMVEDVKSDDRVKL